MSDAPREGERILYRTANDPVPARQRHGSKARAALARYLPAVSGAAESVATKSDGAPYAHTLATAASVERVQLWEVECQR
jgi:hypothetical protein